MAIKRDTPLSISPEPKFTAIKDSINPRKTWQQMSVAEKGVKKKELVSKGGIGRFNDYKDSVSTDASKRANLAFEKNAATRGMTVDQLRKDNKRPNLSIDGLAGEKNTKSSLKSPCKGGTLTSCNK